MFVLSEDKNTCAQRGAEKNSAPRAQFYRDPHACPAHPQWGNQRAPAEEAGTWPFQWKVFLQMTFQMKTRLKK